MNKIKHLLLLVCIAGCFAACKKNSSDNFDEAAQFNTDTTAIRKFIVANKIPAIKDKSGVFYQILAPGTGTVTYSASSSVTVDYTGQLLNGSVFDTSAGVPKTFVLGQLITGWQIGIPLIQPGGKIRLLVPSLYGYGNTAAGTIPASSILDFTIVLSKVQ